MKCMTYYETEELITEKDYQKIFLLLQSSSQHTLEKKTDFIERYCFITSLEGLELPKYSICRKNQEVLYLEKKSLQENITWRECEKITLEEGRRMKEGDIRWMEKDARHLVRDFYLQMTINHLRFAFLETCQREQYRYQKKDWIIFYRNLQRIQRNYTIDCLPCELVQMCVLRARTMPRVLQGMLQGMEFSNEQPAFA